MPGEDIHADRGSIDLAQAREQLAALQPRLEGIEVPVRLPGVDLELAALGVVGVLRRIDKDRLRGRLEAFGRGDWWSIEHLTTVEATAPALLVTLPAVDDAALAVSAAKVPLATIEDATGLRAEMLDVAGYQLRRYPAAMEKVADIRRGRGHLDLTRDLQRLGALYRDYAAVLRDDGFYDPTDADRADRLAGEILGALGDAPLSDHAEARAQAMRIFVLMEKSYDELRAALLFLTRHEGGAERFPPLRSLARATPTGPRPAQPPAQPEVVVEPVAP